MHHITRTHGACQTAIHVHGHGSRDMANRHLICLERHERDDHHERCAMSTISWIFTSWNGLKRQARVCMCSEPLMLFLTHSFSFWQSAIGVNSFLEISWKVSEPQTSHVYELTNSSGFTSETRVTRPRTVMSFPSCAPFTSRTAMEMSES